MAVTEIKPRMRQRSYPQVSPIERGVPMPDPDFRKIARYPFRQMSVGDSFFVTGTTHERIRPAASAAGARLGKKFTVRVTDGGFRVWRTA